MLALSTGQSVTWGDILIILAIIALLIFIFSFLPRFRR